MSKPIVVDLTKLLEENQEETIGFCIPPHTQVQVMGVRVQKSVNIERTYPFHISSACLGSRAKSGERALLTFGKDDRVCASLSLGVCENVSLDLQFEEDFLLCNTHADSTDIHIVGRVLMEDDDDGDDDEDDEEFLGGGSENLFFDHDDDDDDDDDDEIDDDEDDVPPSTVAIEQLPTDDEEDKEEEQATTAPVAKKAKVSKGESKEESTQKKQKTSSSTPNKQELIAFLKEEIKTAGGKAKCTELGMSIAKKFGTSFKKMNFSEKSLGKFLKEARSGIKVDGDDLTIEE